MSGPDFILVGPEKTATTWLYQSLKQHPEVLMPDTDSINYFCGQNYHRGDEWYLSHFDHYAGEHVVGEETPQYIHSTLAPERIAESYPDVQLLVTIRNPIDRAFSHYWHHKSRDLIDLDFEQGINHDTFYKAWVIPGYYHHHIQCFREYFDDGQISLFFFEDLVEDDHDYLKNVYQTVGVDDSFVPDTIEQRVNDAWPGRGYYRTAVRTFVKATPPSVYRRLRPAHEFIQDVLMSTSEYEKGPSIKAQRELIDIYRTDVRRLATYADRDLDHWLEIN